MQKVKLPEKLSVWNNDTKKLELRYSSYAEEKAVISGYGFNDMKIIRNENGKKEEYGSTDYRLRYAESKILSHEECQNKTNSSSMNVLCAQIISRENIHKGSCSVSVL